MGVEDKPAEAHPQVQPSDSIPPETDGQFADMPPAVDQTVNGIQGRARHVSPCMRFAILAMLLLILLISFASAHPFYVLMFAVLAILPAGAVAKFIMTKLKDDAVSEKFLVNQFLVGAIPLSLTVIFIELLIGTILFLAVFSQDLSAMAEALEQGSFTNGTIPPSATSPANTTTSSGQSKLVSVHQHSFASKSFPESMTDIAQMWKIVLFLLLNAFLVAGLVEETGKWLVSRRYRKINSEPSNLECGRMIGCRGVLAVCSMGALGFATVENLAYVLGLSALHSKGFPFGLVALALLRGVLAFPVHVGAQFYVGVAATQKYIFNDQSRVLFALFIAIMLHGSFDAVALVVGLFVSDKRWPEWIMAFVVAFQLCLVAFLMLLCRGRYKALLERERLVVPSLNEV